MKIKNLFQIGLLSAFLLVGSCSDDYDGRFDKLEQQIQDLLAQTAGGAQLAASITSLQSQVTALSAAVGTNNAGLTTSLTALQTKINALQAELGVLAANQTSSSANQALSATALSNAIVALNADVDALKLDLTAILENSNVVNGNLLLNDSSLAAIQAFGTKVAIVTGNVTVNITSSTAVEVNKVMSLLSVVFGDVTITSNKTLDVSNLASVGGNLSLSIAGNLVFTKLTSVTGTVAYTDNAATLLVDFEKLASSGVFNGGSVTFGEATSVKLNGGAIASVTANKANVVQLWAANSATGLTIVAPKAASVITIAGNILGASAAAQVLNVTGSTTSVLNAAAVTKVAASTITALTVNLPALASATGIVILYSTTPVAFPELVSSTNTIEAPAAVSFIAPKLVTSATVTLAAAKTVELASSSVGNLPTVAVVETLTLKGQKVAFDGTNYTALKTLDVTGVAGTTNAIVMGGQTALKTVSMSGVLASVSFTGNTGLTSFTTSGQINSVTVVGAAALVGMTLGHTTITGLNTSTLVVTGNTLLTSLTTSSNFLTTLTVTGNAALATMNFASYTSLIASGTPAVAIHTNNLSGTFTAPTAASGSSAFIEGSVSQASLATLKAYVAAMNASVLGAGGLTALTLNINVDDVDPAVGTTTVLTTAMTMNLQGANNPAYQQTTTPKTALIADTDANAPTGDNDAAASFTKLDTAAEFALIQ